MTCDRCYRPISEGEHGLYLCPLEPRRDVISRSGFEPRFLDGLGEYVTGWGDVKQHMRRKNLDYRERMPKGWHSERRDKIEARKKAARERAEVDFSGVPAPASVACDGPATVLYDFHKRPLRRRIGF